MKELTCFLSKRIKELKVDLTDNKDRINLLLMHFTPTKYIELQRMIKEKVILNQRANMLLHIVSSVTRINFNKSENITELKQHHDILIDQYANDTIQKGIVYSNDHPFFGYLPFQEKLLEKYKEMEDYEKCSSLVQYMEYSKKREIEGRK